MIEKKNEAKRSEMGKKGGKLHYGYKKHIITDEEDLILGVLTTAANVNEISNLDEVSDTADLAKGTYINADKGYYSAKNEEILKQRKLKSRILLKAPKGKLLTDRVKLRNKLIAKSGLK